MRGPLPPEAEANSSEPVAVEPSPAPGRVAPEIPAPAEEAAGAELDRLAEELRGLGVAVAGADSGLRLDLLDSPRFRVDSALVPQEAVPSLRRLGRALAAQPGTRVRVIAHTDRTGAPDYNLELSQRRAAAVVAELTAGGLEAGQVEAEGRGLEEPMIGSDGLPVYVRRIEVRVEPAAPDPRAAQARQDSPR